jgi:acyl-CoA thioester hydrolase
MLTASFKTSFRVSWADTDAAQVTHFSNYFRFFEKAEEELYRHLGFTFADAENRGVWFPRVEAFCRFKKPAKFNDLVEVELTLEELKEKSVTHGFKIFNKESMDLPANGYVIIVAVDKRTEKAVEVPEEMVGKLKSFFK